MTININDIIGKYEVKKINNLSYTVINKDLTQFLGYEMETIIKKADLERVKRQIEKGK